MNTNNNFDISSIIKYSIIGLVLALILGVIFYNLTQFTVFQNGNHVATRLTYLSFPAGVLISVLSLSKIMENRNDALIIGVIVAVLTALLHTAVITVFMGKPSGGWFYAFIGNLVVMVIFGILGAYLGNVHLKR